MRISDWSSDVCSSDLSALAKAALPSASSFTLSPTCWSLPQASITKASLTAMQAMVSTPLALNSAAFCTKPGRCLAEQVGVKAPGTENSTTRSEEHTSELQSLMRTSYAVFCLKKKTYTYNIHR